MIAPKTLTPAAVAALPDGELSDLAAQIVMGWTKVIQDTPRPVRYVWAINAEPKEMVRKGDRRIVRDGSSWSPTNSTVDALALVDVLPWCEFYLSQIRPIWIAEIEGCANGEWRTLARVEHASRARAITEAAVLAAMAMKEEK